ncbi:MAG TPA: hypothetical protein VIH67_08880 [Candidatus Acidoferrum sp.]
MKPFRNAALNLGVRLLSIFLIFLANPLWAKCPTYSVQVRGKIECSFDQDDKVLATLIFFDHQPEASGEETAIDIHDGTFSGRVAFNTYSSAGFLSGDKCYRRPKSMLIRLIEADGIEKDRTSLKMATTSFTTKNRANTRFGPTSYFMAGVSRNVVKLRLSRVEI